MKHFIIIIFLFSLTANGQNARVFEPGIISDGGIFGFTLSPDGRHALWVKSNGKRDTLVIMEAIRKNGKWSTPQVVSFSGTDVLWKDIDPLFAPDGKTVLFQSNRPVENHPGRKRFDIWAVKKTDKGWTAPYHFDQVVNTDSSESYASMAKNGNIYFTMENGSQQGDIFMSVYKNGQYQTPVNLGAVVNTTKREANPFISPDEDYLIYTADKPAAVNDSDLFICFKKNNQWTAPVNMGETINASISEFCPFVHINENRLYFSRTEKAGNRNREDIFYIDHIHEIINRLKNTK